MQAIDELAHALRGRLIERARAGEARGAGAGLEAEVRELVEREAAPLPEAEREALCARVVLLATGLGPLEPLLSDPAVDEVMVNGPDSVYVERRGRLERTDVAFDSDADLVHAIERILAPLGRRVDEASPLCDARLADGSRVNVVIPPLSLSGPCLTVRRFRREGFSLRDLVGGGTLPAELAELLAMCVAARASVLVSGGTGSGKTTTLNALSGAIPGEERIVTIEDAAELGSGSGTWSGSRRGRPTSRGAARSRSGSSCATRCGCGPTASSSARSAAPRRSTCSRRSTRGTTARSPPCTPTRLPTRCGGSRRSL